MDEYIKREDALSVAYKIGKKEYDWGNVSNAAIVMVVEGYLRAVPAADVVEADECERAYAKGWEYGERAAESRRKRGEWVDMIVENGTHWKVCSICHAPSPRNGRDNFCPNCGADMREESDGT